MGYFRKYIENCSNRVSGLFEVVSGKEKLGSWIEVDINKLREDILSAGPLFQPDFAHPFRLECDASGTRLGAIHCQEIEGTRRIIRCVSGKLGTAGRNYSTIEKEFVAVIFAARKFGFHLAASFVVVTDHQPLRCLRTVANPRGRIAGWKLFLQGHEFEVEYKPGKHNVLPDFLSGLAVLNADTEVGMIEGAHLLTGHGRRDCCYRFIRNNFNGEVKRDKTEEVLKKCGVCTYYSTGRRFQWAVVPMSGLFEKLGVDCIGPLPRSDSGSYYIILATYYAGGWSDSTTMKNKTARNVSDFLIRRVFLRHGIPGVIQMDRGGFLNKTVKDLSRKFGAKMKFSTPYHPEAGGKAERTNRTVLGKLARVISASARSWDKFVPMAVYCYNISPQKDLGLGP